MEVVKRERNVLIGKRSRPNYKLARVSGPLLYKLKNRTTYDKHCWICHMECTTVVCEDCTRSYHASCVSRSYSPRTNKKCVQCKLLEKSKLDCQKSNLTQAKLNQLLELLLSRFYARKELEELNINMNYEFLIEVMDVNTIDLKVFESKYESVEHFMADVKRLQHNCYIMHSDNEAMTKLAESFKKFCKNELYDIGLCAECYERKCMGIENVIMDVCTVPHLVVWAKFEIYPYWPAKVLAVNRNKVEVIFFGQHDTASIKYTSCKLFSTQSPNAELEKYYEEEFYASWTEANQYIENVAKKIGAYHVPTLPAKFCAKKLNEQRSAIIQSIQNNAVAEQTIPNTGMDIEPPFFEQKSNEVFI